MNHTPTTASGAASSTTADEEPRGRRAPRFAFGTVGRYALIAELASGGMARVFLAKDPERPGAHGIVAVKCLHDHLRSDETFTQMFVDEARLASLVRHCNVAMVLDYEASDEGYYLVQEYLCGQSFSAIRVAAHESKQDLGRYAALVTKMLADACEGVHAAHEVRDGGRPLEIVHRDIAPDNLFLTYDGVAKLIDFGVASSAIQTHETRTGVLKGKIAYVAPEALRGKVADRRADVWGLGVVAWELLTGERLFRKASDAATLQAIASEPIMAPSAARKGLPKVYDKVILRALDRDPEQRFSTAREFGHALFDACRKTRDWVDQADLAEWMDALFPQGRARAEQLIEMGIELHLEGPTRVFEPGAPYVPPTPSALLVAVPAQQASCVSIVPEAASKPHAAGEERPHKPPLSFLQRRGTALAAGATVVLLGGGAAAFSMAGSSESATDSDAQILQPEKSPTVACNPEDQLEENAAVISAQRGPTVPSAGVEDSEIFELRVQSRPPVVTEPEVFRLRLPPGFQIVADDLDAPPVPHPQSDSSPAEEGSITRNVSSVPIRARSRSSGAKGLRLDPDDPLHGLL